MQPKQVTTNILGVMQELRDAQERSRRAQSRCLELEVENQRLIEQLRLAQSCNARHQPIPADIIPDGEPKDKLIGKEPPVTEPIVAETPPPPLPPVIADLQEMLRDALLRNASLEKEVFELRAALRAAKGEQITES